MLVRFFTLLLAISLVGCGVQQAPPELSKRDLFELKQQCAESVERVLKYVIDFGEHTNNIRTHYNPKLNRCYVVIKWQLNNPDLPTSFHWVIADAQSFAREDATPGDKVWKAAMGDEDIDAVAPDVK